MAGHCYEAIRQVQANYEVVLHPAAGTLGSFWKRAQRNCLVCQRSPTVRTLVATDDLFHTDRVKWTVQFTAMNITNKRPV